MHLATGDRGQQLAALAAGNGTQAAELASGILAAAQGDPSAAEQALVRAQQPIAKLIRAIMLLARGESHLALPLLRQSASDEALPGLSRAYASFYCGIAHVRRRDLQP